MTPVDELRAYLGERPSHRLAFALDFPGRDDALNAARPLTKRVGFFKIGLELFVREGPSIVKEMGELAPVFLDLKLHDIPETVERAAGAAATTGARLLTLHAACGAQALARAVRVAEKSSLIPVAVTVLTSMSADDCQRQGLAPPGEQAMRLASLAWEAGVRAFVASPQEARALRQSFPEALLITPGIRASAPAAGDDQQRTASARAAIAAGSDLLVVGRPLREASDPVAAASRLGSEIEAGLQERA